MKFWEQKSQSSSLSSPLNRPLSPIMYQWFCLVSIKNNHWTMDLSSCINVSVTFPGARLCKPKYLGTVGGVEGLVAFLGTERWPGWRSSNKHSVGEASGTFFGGNFWVWLESQPSQKTSCKTHGPSVAPRGDSFGRPQKIQEKTVLAEKLPTPQVVSSWPWDYIRFIHLRTTKFFLNSRRTYSYIWHYDVNCITILAIELHNTDWSCVCWFQEYLLDFLYLENTCVGSHKLL